MTPTQDKYRVTMAICSTVYTWSNGGWHVLNLYPPHLFTKSEAEAFVEEHRKLGDGDNFRIWKAEQTVGRWS